MTAIPSKNIPIRISAVIITYNEEKNISRCIESVLTIADEILVVDSFSSDSTPEICHSFETKFIQHEFNSHIEQKNYALSQAKYDHCLSLDADEALDEKAIESIIKIKEKFEFDGYTINRLNNYCGSWIRHGGWYPDTKLRLWNRRKGKWGGQNPHDKVEMSKNAATGNLQGEILHYTVDSISAHIKQMNFFTDIAANELHQEGKSFNILHLIFRPLFRFFRDYLLRLGFLDGLPGFVIALISAHGVFLKYCKLYYTRKNNEQSS